MEDVTFDDFGIGVSHNVEKMNVLETYKKELKQSFHYTAKTLDKYQENIVFNTRVGLPLKITANAGSGKTQCIFAKALKMVLFDGIDPTNIVLITFTNRAADEIRERYVNFFKQVVPAELMVDIPLPHISTIHSFGLSLLYRVYGLRRTIITESQLLKLLKSITLNTMGIKKIEMDVIKKLYGVISWVCANNEMHFFCVPCFKPDGSLDKVYKIDDISQDCDQIKLLDKFSNTEIHNKMVGGETLNSDKKMEIKKHYLKELGFSMGTFTEILRKFVEKKGISNTMDFMDMRLLPFYVFNQFRNSLELVWNQYKYFLIDEAQDLNTLDFALAITCDRDSYEGFLK
jgi:superfamily I DNA/RNA helicase